MYRGTTRGQPSVVSRYRYPETPSGVGVTTTLRGPERVYRLRLTKRVANFGVVITRLGRGSRVEPRVVAGVDENRLTGYAGLPMNHNPYLADFRQVIPAAGALSPAPGDYAVVFDSAGRTGAGSFTFRYWVNDVTPPLLRLVSGSIRQGSRLRVTATDAGAGVYPTSIVAAVDGRRCLRPFDAGWSRSRLRDSTPARIGSAFGSRTTRRRRTPRTSRASSRTRGRSPSPSACARQRRQSAVVATRPRSGRLQDLRAIGIRASADSASPSACARQRRQSAVVATRPRSGRLQGSSRDRNPR